MLVNSFSEVNGVERGQNHTGARHGRETRPVRVPERIERVERSIGRRNSGDSRSSSASSGSAPARASARCPGGRPGRSARVG